MTAVYVNYPNKHFDIHPGHTVASRAHQNKVGQRVVRLDATTFSEAIKPFARGEVAFASQAELNDLWLEIHFGDHEFEESVAKYIQRLLGARYRPLAEAGAR